LFATSSKNERTAKSPQTRKKLHFYRSFTRFLDAETNFRHLGLKLDYSTNFVRFGHKGAHTLRTSAVSESQTGKIFFLLDPKRLNSILTIPEKFVRLSAEGTV
jgi:hypothetical protein